MYIHPLCKALWFWIEEWFLVTNKKPARFTIEFSVRQPRTPSLSFKKNIQAQLRFSSASIRSYIWFFLYQWNYSVIYFCANTACTAIVSARLVGAENLDWRLFGIGVSPNFQPWRVSLRLGQHQESPIVT